MRLRSILLTGLVLVAFPATAAANYPHVVAPGETLTSVAALDGLSVSAIAGANGISSQAQLVAGQILWIPPRSAATAGAGAAATTQSATTQSATTQSSTTQSATTQSVATSDPDADSDTDSVGSREGAARSSTRQRASTATGQTQSTATTQSAGTSSQSSAATQVSAPVPTLERASASQIAYIAQANGVPAGLAEAIGWQESGWNNDEVSGVGAVGVMQIVPATWTWIDRYLTPSAPLGTASASENIRAGVLLLRELLQMTGGNQRLAAAGYYQGLASVQAHGMYASTRQYVVDVMALAQRFGG